MADEQTVILKSGNKKPKLFGIWKDTDWFFHLKGKQTFGRPTQSHRPDLYVDVPIVSREHGLFYTDQGFTTYINRSTTNGTYYNDVLMKPNASQLLRDGDVLRIHKKYDQTHLADIILIYSNSYADDTVWKTIDLTRGAKSLSVGRAGKSQQFTDQSVSRQHATFMYTPVGWAVVDHQSSNGVYVNNRRILNQEFLMPMDVIRIAGYHFIYTGERLIYQAQKAQKRSRINNNNPFERTRYQSTGPTLEIHIEKKEVWQKFHKKRLLQDIDLKVDSGSLILILGGSGAGKTTFIQAVMGYEKAKGLIKYDGRNLYREYKKMQHEIAYVPQADLLRGYNTAYKTLENALDSKLIISSKQKKHQRIMDTLKRFGLQNQKDTLVSQLAGGEKKRLSTACEYITGPSLFFLDEPDSGLDAANSATLMKLLREIADDGKIVFVISHSPNRVAEHFDKVIVLAKSRIDNIGHLAFYGSVREACQFFQTDYKSGKGESKDLESIVKKINSKQEGGQGLSDYYIEKYQKLKN